MNAFWMSSLAFSIFCTIWSQLSSRWILSKFHSRGSEWVNIIVGSMPTILLSMACATFGGGLVCLAYTFFPHTAIPPIVIVQIVGLTTAGAVFLIWRFVDGMLLHPYWKHKAAIFGGASSIRMHRRRSRQEYGDPAVSLQRRASADDLEKGENRGLSRSPSSIDVMVQLPATPEVSTPAMGSDTILRIHSVPMKETSAQFQQFKSYMVYIDDLVPQQAPWQCVLKKPLHQCWSIRMAPPPHSRTIRVIEVPHANPQLDPPTQPQTSP